MRDSFILIQRANLDHEYKLGLGGFRAFFSIPYAARDFESLKWIMNYLLKKRPSCSFVSFPRSTKTVEWRKCHEKSIETLRACRLAWYIQFTVECTRIKNKRFPTCLICQPIKRFSWFAFLDFFIQTWEEYESPQTLITLLVYGVFSMYATDIRRKLPTSLEEDAS